MTPRLPAQLEVGALRRSVSSAGGFATVIQKGEPDAGTLMVICCENGANARVYERMPDLEGDRNWTLVHTQDTDNPHVFTEYLARRMDRDRDLWIVELDIVNGERFIGLPPLAG